MNEYHVVKVDGELYVPLSHWETVVADRDRWFRIADAMASCLDSSTEAGDALREYERAVRGE